MRPAKVEVVEQTTSAQVFPLGYDFFPATLWVRPASGNTFTVEYSTDNGANWQLVPGLNGANAYSEVILQSGITHVRITPSGTQGGSWGVC